MNTLSKMVEQKETPEVTHPEAPSKKSKNAGFKKTLKRQMAQQKALHERLQQQKEEKIAAQQLERDQQEAAHQAKLLEVEGKLASTCATVAALQATVKDLMVKYDATVARLETQQLQHGDAIQAMERSHNEETSRLQDLMSGLEDRNKELVEAVDLMRETASRNLLKISQVEKELIAEKDTSARLQQTLQATQEDLSSSEAALAATVAANEEIRGELEGLQAANLKAEEEIAAIRQERSRQEEEVAVAREKLEEQEFLVNELKVEGEELRERVREREQEVREKEETVKAAEEEAREAREEAGKIQDDLAAASDKLELQAAEIQAQNAAKKQLLHDKAAAETENMKLQQELEELNSQLVKIKKAGLLRRLFKRYKK